MRRINTVHNDLTTLLASELPTDLTPFLGLVETSFETSELAALLNKLSNVRSPDLKSSLA